MHQRFFAAGLALVIGCATPIVVDSAHQDATAQAQRQADDQSREQLQLARELPANPPDVAGAFVDLLAQGGPFATQQGCLLFSNSAAAQFAAAQHASTCIAAMDHLHRLVSDPATYTNNLTVPDTAWTQLGTTATLNGCALDWSAPLADTSDTDSAPLGLCPACGRCRSWTARDERSRTINHAEPQPPRPPCPGERLGDAPGIRMPMSPIRWSTTPPEPRLATRTTLSGHSH